jgi:hypothetical protein
MEDGILLLLHAASQQTLALILPVENHSSASMSSTEFFVRLLLG